MNTDPNAVPDPNGPNAQPQKKSWTNWVGPVVVIIAIIILLLWRPWSSNGNDNTTKAKNDSIALANLHLQKDLIALAKQKRECDSMATIQRIADGKALKRADSLLNNCYEQPEVIPAKKVVRTPQRRSTTTVPIQRLLITVQNNTGNPVSVAPTSSIPRKVSNLVSSPASYTTEQGSVDKTNFNKLISEKKLCARFGTEARGYMFWPHLGVMDGQKFGELVDNKIGGYDLFILPSGSVGEKNYGISSDGTRYVSKTLLSKFLKYSPDGQIYFINDFGYFVAAQEVGDFYILPAAGNVAE